MQKDNGLMVLLKFCWVPWCEVQDDELYSWAVLVSLSNVVSNTFAFVLLSTSSKEQKNHSEFDCISKYMQFTVLNKDLFHAIK